MRDLLRQLADVEPTDLPVLSVYLDIRPQATGETPELRSGLVVLKDRMREIERTFLPRGPALDSFRADAERIDRFLEQEASPSAQGLAIFSCDGIGLFETIEAGVAFDNQVSAGSAPDLFQLARLLDEHETTVVALVDSNTARLFVSRLGFIQEHEGPDDASIHYRKRSMGGWSQARYQRHIDKHRADFASEAATEIERLVDEEKASRVVLAGDEVAIPLLRDALSPSVAEIVEPETLRIHIRTPQDEVRDEVRPILAQAEASESCGIADRLIGAVQAGSLGAAGLKETRRALENGQVDILVLAADAELEEEERSELVRMATATSADVEVVQDHEGIRQIGGVGALLRYRLPEVA